MFGDDYFAKSHAVNAEEHLRFETVEAAWKEAGRKPLPGYFHKFGVISARTHLGKIDAAEVFASRRAPTDAEGAGIVLLIDLLRDLALPVHAIFAKGNTSYAVVRSETVLGALRSGRGYRSREVFPAESLFVGDFAEAVATFLHEHSHIFGHDGERGFTDALTDVLATVVRARRALDRPEKGWATVREAVVRERQARTDAVPSVDLAERLRELPAEELRGLLERLPPALVRQAMGDDGGDEPEGE